MITDKNSWIMIVFEMITNERSVSLGGIIKMNKKRLVVIGNGMAGLKTIEYLLRENSSLYNITIFGSEPYTNYSRIMLSSVLQGNVSFEDITIHDWQWYKDHQIKLFTNETVLSIERNKKLIITDKERTVPYDHLIIATGSNPFILPVPGIDKKGVMSFRTIDDCKEMIDVSKQHKKAAVIGGGLLGLEAARGLLNLGMDVNVIHLSNQLMNHQLDQTAGSMLKHSLEEQGMRFIFEKETAEILGTDRVEGLRFLDGTRLETDLVVMAVGIRPNISLADQAKLETNKGIIVNNVLQTNDPDIFAVGECAEHKGAVYGLVKPLYDQAEILAKHLTNQQVTYQGSTIYTQLKISGIDLFSVGQINETETTKAIYTYDSIADSYKKVLFENDKAIGAVLFGDTSMGSILLDHIQKKKFIPNNKKTTLLQAVKIEESYAATLPKNENICTCNNVSKGCIIEQVLAEDLSTVNDVKKSTKASSSCGGCKPVVQELLDYINSDFFDEKVKDKRFCNCTTLSEDEIVREIQEQKLTNLDMVFNSLNWKNLNGCETCIPALHYYLDMIYPEYQQNDYFFYLDPQTNAWLETDGTYSVTPQLYGGKATSSQLRKIEAVLRKYSLPSLTITEDQRLKITGIHEKNLISICSDLNMRLHSPENHVLKKVQIIGTTPQIGNEIENIAYQIEKQTEFLTMASNLKVKLFTNKALLLEHYFDLALIKENAGWELIVQENSKQSLLAIAKTNHEIIYLTLSFLQYYRQSANFNEKVGTWLERAGMVHVREVLFDQENQTMLLQNLHNDQSDRTKTFVSTL